MFIAVDNNYITTDTITKEDCEIKWCEINIAGNQPLHIGAFHRQPNSGSEEIEELEKAINTIVEGSKGNLPNIILDGDFNLPHIDWGLNTVKPNHQYRKEINKKLTDIVNENELTQVVRKPKRGNNILDLIFTTNHGLISSVEVHPGMSDHNVIITDVNLKAKSAKKKPRKVLLYKKADMDGLKTFIKDKLSEKTIGSHISSENWNYLKRTITEAISKFVPQKTFEGKQHVPWITTHIKRLIRRRQRRYIAAKKHNTNKIGRKTKR